MRHRSPEADSYEELLYVESVDGSVSEVTWTHFSLSSNDSILVEVRAENGAGERTRVSSTPFTIDLSPPHLEYLVDGSIPGQDLVYQSVSHQLNVSWEAHDPESLINTVKISVWELAESRRLLVFPDPFVSGQSSLELPDPTVNTYTLSDLNLSHGSKYITVLTLENGAGLVSEYESSGVTVDLTPPQVARVAVEGERVLYQNMTTLTVTATGAIESSTLSIRWSALDIESGVTGVFVGVVDKNNSFVTPTLARYEGYSTGGVLEDFDLNVGSRYRVAVVAVNSAGAESETAFSEEFL